MSMVFKVFKGDLKGVHAELPGEGPESIKEVILGTGFDLFRDSVAEYLAPEAAGWAAFVKNPMARAHVLARLAALLP